MSKYKNSDTLIDELLFVIQYAETDLRSLRQADNSGRISETLREIERVRELVTENTRERKIYKGTYPLDLFNRRL